MKRKLVSVLMAAMLLTGCAGDVQTNVATEGTQVEATTQETAAEESKGAALENTEATEATEAEEVAYEIGTYTETGYESPFVGYVFETPEGCTLATQEEILAMAGISNEMAEDAINETFDTQLEITMLYELFAAYPSGTSVNVGVQAMDTHGFTVEQIVEATIPQYEQLENMSIKVSDDRGYEELFGREFYKMSVEAQYPEYGDMVFFQEQYVTVFGGKQVIITFSCEAGNEAERDALKEAFKPIA